MSHFKDLSSFLKSASAGKEKLTTLSSHCKKNTSKLAAAGKKKLSIMVRKKNRTEMCQVAAAGKNFGK